MNTKQCKRCKETKTLSEFYAQMGMKDGHLNFCKDCCKKRVLKHRNDNIDRIRECDRNRPNKGERTKKHNERMKDYRKDFPNKYSAHNKLNNAVRDGKIMKQNFCSACGCSGSIIGHHNDYLKPLDVVWMCQVCHLDWHKINGEGLNGF